MEIIKDRYPDLENDLLESYDHIQLTEQELKEAVLEAKMKKHKRLEYEKELEAIQERRKALTFTGWTTPQTKGFMLNRAANLFGGRFTIDQHNTAIFDLLCMYFSLDKDFPATAINMGIKNPSLDKGILLFGGYGSGKTWMMQLFEKNKSQCYVTINAKNIADKYEVSGGENSELINPITNPVNDAEHFYQPYTGICIDDIGTEDVKNNYGNKKNVIGDLIELKYAKGKCGRLLHGTTNLTAKELNEFYGDRIISRMREVFNIIHLPGSDRRK